MNEHAEVSRWMPAGRAAAMLLAMGAVGALVGFVIALSESPLTPILVGSLLTLTTGYLAATDKKSPVGVTPLLGVAVFAFTVLAVLDPAIRYRERQIKAPSLEDRAKEFAAVFGDDDAKRVLLVELFGRVPAGMYGRPYPAQESPSPPADEHNAPYVLKTGEIDRCLSLGRFSPDTDIGALLSHYESSGISRLENLAYWWKTDLPEARRDETELLRAITDHLCRIDAK